MNNKSKLDIYRPMDVPNSIKPYVRRVLGADTDNPVDMDVEIRSTGYHYLGWIWRGRWAGIRNEEIRFDSDCDGPISLSGQVNKNKVIARFQRDVGNFFLEFTALGHYQLLGINGEQVLEDAVDPRVLNPALNAPLELIFNAKNSSANARLELLADALSGLPKYDVPEHIIAVLERIESVDGNIQIADLVDEFGLAERQFRTDFKRLVGLTPKTFCKTLQINQALNDLLKINGGDLASVAHETGFSDQAHFTRAFSDFLGTSPGGFIESVDKTLARFMGQSRQ